MTTTQRADKVLAQLTEMDSKTPTYNSDSVRLEFCSTGEFLRGVKVVLTRSRTLKIPKEFRVPQKEYWGRPHASSSDFPPIAFAETGMISISAAGPALYSKASDGWQEVT